MSIANFMTIWFTAFFIVIIGIIGYSSMQASQSSDQQMTTWNEIE